MGFPASSFLHKLHTLGRPTATLPTASTSAPAPGWANTALSTQHRNSRPVWVTCTHLGIERVCERANARRARGACAPFRPCPIPAAHVVHHSATPSSTVKLCVNMAPNFARVVAARCKDEADHTACKMSYRFSAAFHCNLSSCVCAVTKACRTWQTTHDMHEKTPCAAHVPLLPLTPVGIEHYITLKESAVEHYHRNLSHGL